MRKLLASLLVLTASGCPDIKVDQDEVAGGPTVEFDPARSLATGARFIPFPNDLARDPTTGKINIGTPMCPESPAAMNTRVNVLNKLDGFGTYQLAMQVTFTEAVDPASVVVDPMSADNNVVMYQVANAGMPLDPTTAMPIPLVVRSVGTTLRQLPDDCANPETVNAVVFVPAVPLRQKSTYVVALKSGIKNADGTNFQGSYTWGLVSANDAPVTLDDAGNIISDKTPLDPSGAEDRASLLALNQLWQGHAPVLTFLDNTPLGPASRTDLLVAFAFTTQTVTDPLDPTVPTSPAAMLSSAGFVNALGGSTFLNITQAPTIYPAAALANCPTVGITDPEECFLALSFGGCKPFTSGCNAAHALIGQSVCQAPGASPTGAGRPAGTYDCSQIGGIFAAGLLTQNYQAQIPNTLAASPGVTVTPNQGAWSDPINPTATGMLALEVVATIPTGTEPTNGWPTVIFGHGLTSNKESVFAIAGALARKGFASVAIDFSQHGKRAVRTSTAIALGCKGHCFTPNADPTMPGTDLGTECETTAQCTANTGDVCGNAPVGGTATFMPPNAGDAPQCYTPIFTGDLANTRDNVRQTVLDLQRLVKALKTCTGDACGPFNVDATRIYYGGISLGSIIGSMPASMVPDIKAASLNVGGVGFLDVIENTGAVSLRCSLVNALIDAGILTGTKWAGGSTGLCVEDNGNAWKAQPSYATFSSIARWVLDPADPANFVGRLRAKTHMIQKVTDDGVVPNVSTDRQGAISGAVMNSGAFSAFAGAGVASSFVSTNPTQSKFVVYTTDANHTFVHSSLLRPATLTAGGFAGTWRLQADFAAFLDQQDQ